MATSSQNPGGIPTAHMSKSARNWRNMKPGHHCVTTWLALLVAPIVTALLIAFMGWISMRFRPLPESIVLWPAAVLGGAAGIRAVRWRAFIGQTVLPFYVMPAIVLLSALLAYGTAIAMRNGYRTDARAAIFAQIDALSQPPTLPSAVPDCIALAILPVQTAHGTRIVRARFEDDRTHELAAKVNLSRAELQRGHELERFLCRMADTQLDPPLTTALDAYPALRDRPVTEAAIHDAAANGRYAGRAVLDRGVPLAFEAQVTNDAFRCVLKRESHVRATAMHAAEQRWREVEPGSTSACVNVTLDKAIDRSHWNANALLADGTTFPLTVEHAAAQGNAGDVAIYLEFETAVRAEVNLALRELAASSTEPVPSHCVRVEDQKQLRTDEFAMRAHLPDRDPWFVLARKDGYSVSVELGAFRVLMPPGTERPRQGWSLLVPGHYALVTGEKSWSTARSLQDEIAVSLAASRAGGAHSTDLQFQAARDAGAWKTRHPDAELDPPEPVRTDSGVDGVRYVARRPDSLRVKYFFGHGQNVAVLTFNAAVPKNDTLERCGRIAATVRFKDRPGH